MKVKIEKTIEKKERKRNTNSSTIIVVMNYVE